MPPTLDPESEQPATVVSPRPRPADNPPAARKRAARDLIREAEDDESWFKRNRLLLGIFLLLGGVGAFVVKNKDAEMVVKSAPPPEPVLVQLNVPPPPPPPPPPPKTEPPPPKQEEEKMEEQAPVEDEKPPEEPAPAAPALGSNIEGKGGDSFGLGKATRGGAVVPRTIGGGGRSKFGWYATQVQSRITDALRGNKRTKSAIINGLEVRIWADSQGRITRATLGRSTGNEAVDQALREEVLRGLQLNEPPPKDMKMPIVLRVNARRPS